jgi:uncharacterized protein (TIGR03083 family)
VDQPQPHPPLGYDRYHAELDAETGKLAAAVHDADPARPVPTCPEWTLGQLTAHVGRGHRWAATIVERRATELVPVDEVEVRVPDDPDGRSAWLLAGARRLGDAVREAGPHTGVWAWAAEQSAGFWLRRVTYDTLVHRLDAELAVGRAVALAPDLAADCISELLDVLSTPGLDAHLPAIAELRGTGQTLHFHATDAGLGAAGEWLVRRTPSGVEWEHGHGKGDVALRGRVVDLLLVLSRRAAPGDSPVEVLGDVSLLAHWLDHTAF